MGSKAQVSSKKYSYGGGIMVAAQEVRKRKAPRRWVRLWIPNQHGAWAMVIVPVLIGSIMGGFQVAHILLILVWVLAYFAYFTIGIWLKSGRKKRYLQPAATYAVGVVLHGLIVVGIQWQILAWLVCFIPLLAVAWWYSHRRRERALTNDAVTVAAASLLVPIAWQFPDQLPWQAPSQAWVVAVVAFWYFFGTALYVKTMIRERNNPVMFKLSVSYHSVGTLVTAALTWVAGGSWPLIFAFGVLMTARAWLVPRRFSTATPLALGVGEIIASAMLLALILIAF